MVGTLSPSLHLSYGCIQIAFRAPHRAGLDRCRSCDLSYVWQVVACEPIANIMAVDPSAYPHASNALAYLDGGGQVIFHGTVRTCQYRLQP